MSVFVDSLRILKCAHNVSEAVLTSLKNEPHVTVMRVFEIDIHLFGGRPVVFGGTYTVCAACVYCRPGVQV